LDDRDGSNVLNQGIYVQLQNFGMPDGGQDRLALHNDIRRKATNFDVNEEESSCRILPSFKPLRIAEKAWSRIPSSRTLQAKRYMDFGEQGHTVLEFGASTLNFACPIVDLSGEKLILSVYRYNMSAFHLRT